MSVDGDVMSACKFLTLCLSLITLLAGFAGAAQAKLGESFAAYKGRIAKSMTPAGQKDNNYMFTMNVQPQALQASPGYAGGVTITVINGKITGQSLAIRPGIDPFKGGALATIHGMVFAYEAIGKTFPNEQAKREQEFKAFSGAVTAAFMGRAQNLKYPGLSGQVTVSRDATGNLIVACKVPTAPAAQKAAASK